MHTRVYVIECESEGYYYVGSTVRLPWQRLQEHKDGYGSSWTSKHGYKKCVVMIEVPPKMCKELEDKLTCWLQGRYGWRYVRGGDRTALCEEKMKRWLHESMASLAPTDVLPLHLRPMGQFPTELRALIDRFEMVCGFENPDHLDTNVESEPVLCGITDELHHVFSTKLVAIPLGAQ